MASNITFTMIKPDAVAAGHIGAILAQINKAGFKIVAMKYTKLSAEKAGEFYDVHRERGFFGELVDFMSSGPIVATVLEKDNAVEDFRTLIGATDPAKAAPGTIRGDYSYDSSYLANTGKRPIKNLLHASGNLEEAQFEVPLWFSKSEIASYTRVEEEVMR